MTTAQENIRQLREERKFSQEEMAEKLGISKNGYGKIERGESDIKLTRLVQIADILDIDVVEIMKDNNREMAFVIGENHGTLQNNYNSDHSEIERLNPIIQHQQEKIADLQEMIAILKERVK